jgi:hypothetical protein
MVAAGQMFLEMLKNLGHHLELGQEWSCILRCLFPDLSSNGWFVLVQA